MGYNSDRGKGWLGEGWDLPMRSVTIDTRWGVPRYDREYETETYLLEGMQLTPLAHRGELKPRRPEKVFRSRVEGDFKQIIRHGERPTDYWWEVTDKNGIKYYYGGRSGVGMLPAAVLADPATGNIFTWALAQVKDLHGNTVDYEYALVVGSGVGQGYSAVPGRQLYLKTIRYTGFEGEPGPYSVNFLRDRDLRAAGADEPRRKDVVITARSGFKVVTADLLRKVEVKYGDQPVRSYELVYKEGAFGKSLLEYIIQYGADGEEFYRHQFAYYDEVTGEDGYRGFEAGQESTAGYDNLRENLTVDDVKLSALGGSVSSTKNWYMYTGLGLGSKRRSAGYKVGGSDTDTETLVFLVDLNGDGLPDKVFKKGGSVCYRPNISRAGAEPAFSGRN